MNTNSITLEMPEIGLFDARELKLKLSNYIKTLASMTYKRNDISETTQDKWGYVEISPEVMAMTFENRVDLGTTDYRKLLDTDLEQRFQ